MLCLREDIFNKFHAISCMKLVANLIYMLIDVKRSMDMALAHAILAFLAVGPCSGYGLAKEFDGSVGCFWEATHQQIYRELAKLENRGWVSFETIPQENRLDKKLYHLTELGQKQLTEWIAQPTELAPTREDLLVKTFVAYLVPPQIIVKELERRRQTHLKKLSIYQDKEQQYKKNPQELSPEAKLRYLLLRRGIRYEADWVGWCDEALHLLS